MLVKDCPSVKAELEDFCIACASGHGGEGLNRDAEGLLFDLFKCSLHFFEVPSRAAVQDVLVKARL